MPVDTKHPDYETAAPKWCIMAHCIDGEMAVKEAGIEYLPKLSEQSEQEYAAYKTRAQFFEATGRTLASLLGFIFRKDPTVLVDDALAQFMADATMSGLSFYDYTKEITRAVLGKGRGGTLVDFDSEGEKRPYVVHYCAENIHNWKCDRYQGRTLLSLLTLHERSSQWIPLTEKERRDGPPDEFENATWPQWRVYRLLRDGEGEPFVQCTVYRKKDEERKSEAEFVVISQMIPTRRGLPLERIPFVFHNVDNGLPDVGQIPLLGLALVNLSLYRTSADLEHGRHFAGLPTPWAAGFGGDDEDEDLQLGSTVAWASADSTAKCGFLEFTGTGLGALDKGVEQKKGELAALGARMLEPEAKKAEAFDTVAVRAAAETSALQSISISCTQTLSVVLQWVAWWIGTAETPEDLADTHKTTLNTEFVISTVPPDMLTALFNGYLSGAIDFETLFHNLQRGEIIPPERTLEEARQSIEENPPAMLQAQTEPAPAPANA